MILSTTFQLIGTILLAYGLVFRNSKDIIGDVFSPTMTSEKVPEQLKDKIIDAYLCKWGLSYMAIGYILNIFEPEWATGFIYKFFAVVIIGILIFIVARVHSEHSGEVKYSNITPEDLKDNAKEGTLYIEVIKEKNT